LLCFGQLVCCVWFQTRLRTSRNMFTKFDIRISKALQFLQWLIFQKKYKKITFPKSYLSEVFVSSDREKNVLL